MIYDEAFEKRKLEEILEQYKEVLENLKLVIRSLPSKYQHNPEVLDALLRQYENKERVLTEGLKKPYFARIDFKDDETKEENMCYIGKVGVTDFDQNTVTVDWRAPIASLYYDSNLGKTSYKAPEGIINGTLSLKRQYDIESGKLISFNDVDTVANDEILRPYLSVNADNRLKNIVSSIQSEQNEVIRKDLTDNIIVQGVAGSGKTTVALHRIAYLAYNYRNKIKSNQYMIIGPNKFFIKYISSVLPDLDVTDVPQLTYEEFTKEYLGEDFSLAKEKISKTDFNVNKFKMSLDYKTVIDEYINYLEKEKVLPLKDFCIKDFNILPKEEIRKIYDNIDDRYITDIESKIERTILMASTYLKNNQDKVLTALMAEYNKLLDNAKDNKTKTAINQTYDKIKKELESCGLSSSLRKYFTFRSKKTTALYSDMIRSIEKYYDNKDVKEIKDNEPKEKNTFTFEDLPGLVYLHYRLHGSGIYKDYRQTVIDEAQDYGTFNFYALKQVLSSSSFSIFGDLAQSIYDYRSIDNWNDVISKSFDNDCNLEYLLKSYRTTMEIMNSANLVLSHIGLKTATPVIRHGEDVRYLKIKENDYNRILERVNLLKEKDYQSIALISRDTAEAKEMADNLAKLGLDIKSIGEDNVDYDSGICSLSSELSKGLEFDAVILTDASEDKYSSKDNTDMKNLYVSMTRPLHELEILYDGEITLPLKKEAEKTFIKR